MFFDALADPAWFPDRLDPRNALVRLVRTRHDILATSAFIDGRTPIGDAPPTTQTVGFDKLGQALAARRGPMRWLLHESFCGSTLLARLLSIEGHALCLREPHVLVDLCNWRLAGGGAPQPGYRSTLDACLAKLDQRWAEQEAIVIKPSNWITPAVADLWRPHLGDRAVRLRIAVEPFLVAVLRGGNDRIAYVARLYDRLATAWPEIDRAVITVLAPEADPTARALQTVAASHWAQACVLDARGEAAEIAAGEGDIAFSDLRRAPIEAAALAARHLSLDLSPARLAASAVRVLPVHAKSSEPLVPAEVQAKQDDALRRRHRRGIAAALMLIDQLDRVRAMLVGSIAAQMRLGEALADTPRVAETAC